MRYTMSITEMDFTKTGRRVDFKLQIQKLTFNPASAIDDDPGEEAEEKLAEEGYQRPLASPTFTRQAWYVLIASFIVLFFAVGPIYSYCIVLNKLMVPMLPPSSPGASIALISSLACGLMAAGFPFAGWLAEKTGHRVLTVTGLLMTSVGLLLSSFSFSFWQVIITQGIMVGCGTCLVFYTASTISLPWFRLRRRIPIALNALAIGLGGVVYAFIYSTSLDSRTSLRISAAMVLFPSIIVTPFLKKRMPSLVRERVVDFSRLRDFRMLGLLIVCFLTSLSFLMPFNVFIIFSDDYSLSQAELTRLIAAICGGLALGGTVLPFLSIYLGIINTMLSSLFFVGLMGLTVWLFNTDFIALAAFAILHGMFSGSMLTMLPLSAFLLGVPSAIQTLGTMYLANGIATMIGPPTASAFIEMIPFGRAWPYPFLPAVIFTSATTIISGTLLLWVKRKFNIKRRYTNCQRL
ncbi:hypothetical protein DSO57_1030965 [Entomophthora muscae]|uniref:Uncharacterized protein n=1 Tax=Entomophthora muscae TaxID=34485 RepID=A0ACC2ULS3_9FUNG|nr:hypothetical protein DSO57_1030965 [Entomophthora muscae]